MLPQEGEKLQILGDISQVNNNPRVQRALKRLATAKAPTSLSQLVMWRVATDLDWNTIAHLSQAWANRHELTLAQDFVDHLDDLTEGETGRLLFEVEGTDASSKPLAIAFTKALQGTMVLGLLTAQGIPARPAGPALACRIRFSANDASVQLTGSDESARKWVPFGRFTQPLVQENGNLDHLKFADSLAEGGPQPLGPGTGNQRFRPERTRQVDLSDSNRERVSTHPQWTGVARHGEQGRRSAQGLVRDCDSAAQIDARSNTRGERQDAGPEEGHQNIGARPERAVTAAK